MTLPESLRYLHALLNLCDSLNHGSQARTIRNELVDFKLMVEEYVEPLLKRPLSELDPFERAWIITARGQETRQQVAWH